jgi:DNA-directed RNA polymerase subunit E'/Rpb7
MVANADLVEHSRCTEVVRLPPHQLKPDFRDTLLRLLKARLEGQCSRHGYILQDSITLVDTDGLHLGRAELDWLNADHAFEVTFDADVCNIAFGDVVYGQVVKNNRFGVLVEVSMTGGASKTSHVVIEVVVTKQSVGYQSEIDLDSVADNDFIYVEILGWRCVLHQDRISAVGRALQGPVPMDDDAQLRSDWDAAPPETMLMEWQPPGSSRASEDGASTLGSDSDDKAGDDNDEVASVDNPSSSTVGQDSQEDEDDDVSAEGTVPDSDVADADDLDEDA